MAPTLVTCHTRQPFDNEFPQASDEQLSGRPDSLVTDDFTPVKVCTLRRC